MPPAADLTAAAGQAYNRLYAFWTANTLKTKLTAFAATAIANFPQQQQGGHPVSNWLALVEALADQMLAGPSQVTYDQFNLAANYVYRLCWVANYLVTITQITARATFGTPRGVLLQVPDEGRVREHTGNGPPLPDERDDLVGGHGGHPAECEARDERAPVAPLGTGHQHPAPVQ